MSTETREHRLLRWVEEIRDLLGPLTTDPVEGVRKLAEDHGKDRRHMALSDASAQVVSFAAALNGDVVFGDNKLETTMRKLRELEEAVARLRKELEAERGMRS